MLHSLICCLFLLITGSIIIKLSSAFILYYQTTTGIGYCFPGTNVVLKSEWNLEICSRKLVNQNFMIFIEFSEVLSINNLKVLEIKFEFGPSRELVFPDTGTSAEE